MTAIFNPTGPAPLTPPARATAAGVPQPAVRVPLGPVLEVPGAPGTALVPVTHDGRPVGAYVVAAGRVRYRPAFDPDQLLAAAAGVLAVGLVAAAVAARGRRAPAIGAVTMGPGGWVSLKGLALPPPRAPRPWWARLLRARRLIVER